MFIIENKKITGAKSLSIGKAQQFDVLLKFVDTTFSDADIFELTIDGKKSSLYGFVESGCLRFTRVDFSWIVAENTTAPISVKCNGIEILSDSIDITAEVCGGGGTGGGSAIEGNPATGHRVRFFDYQGTLLKTHYVETGQSANPPTTPEHERLLFQQWNNDFSNITRAKDVGAIYTTKSGASEFDIVLGYGNDLQISCQAYFNAGWTIDWGDGTNDTYPVGSSSLNRRNHTYSNYGRYTVKVICSAWAVGTNLSNLFANKDIIEKAFFATGHTIASNQIFAVSGLTRLTECTFASGIFASGTRKALSFTRCNSLKALICAKDQTLLYSEVTQNTENFITNAVVLNDNMTGVQTLSDTRVSEIIIPDSVIQTGGYIFQNSYIREVYMPSGVTSIYPNTFYGCTMLTTVTLASPNLTQIAQNAFYNCKSLTDLYLYAETPPVLNSSAFNDEVKLACIHVPVGCAEAYKAAANWSQFAAIIKDDVGGDDDSGEDGGGDSGGDDTGGDSGDTSGYDYDKLTASGFEGTGLNDTGDISYLNGTWTRVTTTDDATLKANGFKTEQWQLDDGIPILLYNGTEWVVMSPTMQIIKEINQYATPWDVPAGEWYGEFMLPVGSGASFTKTGGN